MFAAVIVSTLLLLWPAALNGYPIVYVDTGNYLGQALRHYVGWNAPPFYSIFLLATDWRISLWLPIAAQSLIVTHLLCLVLSQFGWRGPWPLLLTSSVLAATSSLPWFVSFLTPYVFVGVVVLALWLLAFGRIGAWQRWYLNLLAIGAVAVHFSHVMLAVALAVVGGAVAGGYCGWHDGARAFARMVIAPAVVCALLAAVNLAAHGTLAVAPYGSVLVAARMLYDGTALDYLRVACPTEQYRICAHLAELPDDRDDFLFNTPLLRDTLGGAKAWAPEARAIVYGTLAYEPVAVAEAGFGNAMNLFGYLWLRRALRPWPQASGPEGVIAEFFPPRELAAYRAAAQSRGVLQAEGAVTAPLQVALAWLGIAGLLGLICVERRRPGPWTLCVLVLAAMVGNAMITGALSGFEDHYEARLAWLAVFTPALVLARRLTLARRAEGSVLF